MSTRRSIRPVFAIALALVFGVGLGKIIFTLDEPKPIRTVREFVVLETPAAPPPVSPTAPSDPREQVMRDVRQLKEDLALFRVQRFRGTRIDPGICPLPNDTPNQITSLVEEDIDRLERTLSLCPVWGPPPSLR